MKYLLGCILLLSNSACLEAKLNIPTGNEFDGKFAKKLIETQTAFGPRVPGTKAHVQTGDWIVGLLKEFKWQVIEQKGEFKKSRLRNIIASIGPEKKERLLFTAHWDTRPITDQGNENQDKPGPGANDGGSGVAVLLEMARILGKEPPAMGVDLIFWDAEDAGNSNDEDSYCLGTQYWAKNLHVPNYKARFGVNLDMVGAPGARFPIEGFSLQKGKLAVEKVLAAADKVGSSAYFERTPGGYITDDHLYVMNGTGIPMMDVIHLRSSGGFYEHWHTHQDTADKLSETTLKAVGETMLAVVKAEK